jgi:hypothetical protein
MSVGQLRTVAIFFLATQISSILAFCPLQLYPHVQRAHLRAKGAIAVRCMAAPPKEESPAMTVLRDGIKAVGVGVKGSKPIPSEIVEPLASVSNIAIHGIESGKLHVI